MSRKIVSFDFAMSSTEGEMYTNKLSEQRVYTNDTNSVELEFNITDVAPGYLPSVGANAILYIYMADGSFFVKYEQHVKLDGNRFYYVLNEEEVKRSGMTKVQLVIKIGNTDNASPLFDFKIINGLVKYPVRPVEIRDWDALTSEARAFVNEVQDLSAEKFVELKMDEKLINLERDYAGRLQKAENELNAKPDKGNVLISDINKNSGKFDSTYFSDSFLDDLMNGSIDVTRLLPGSVTLDKTTFYKVSSNNLFNKNTAENGALNSQGAVSGDPNFYTSDFIEVNQGDVINTSHNLNSYVLYNSSEGVFEAAISQLTTQVTIPAGVKYIRVTFYHTNLHTFMLSKGSLPSVYEPFRHVIDSQYLDEIDGDSIDDGTISTAKLSFLVPGKNLFNPNEVLTGQYVNPEYGNLLANPSYNTTFKKPGEAGQYYTVTTARFIAFFDHNGNIIASRGLVLPDNPTNYTFAMPENAETYQISYSSSVENMQIEKGTEATSYSDPSEMTLDGVSIPVDKVIGLESLQSSAYQTTKSSSKADNLSSGQQIKLTSNSIKKNKTLSFSAKINTFNSIRIGHGETEYGASYIEIDSSSIKFYDMLTSATLRSTINHNLTISNFIDVLLTVDKDSLITVRVMTDDGGIFESEKTAWNGYNGAPFAKSINSALSDCELVWDTSDYDKPIYLFGDSYTGLTVSDRWPNYIRAYGFDNWLVNGFPGQASATAKDMFDFLVSKATPKMLIWALGMNDADTASAVNSTWLSVYNYVEAMCEAKGIEFIPCTIPNVPIVNNSFKNDIVRNSGHRYIDFNKAVGAESDVNWYTGMLSVDQIHPTALGAKKLAQQAIHDVPEIAKA